MSLMLLSDEEKKIILNLRKEKEYYKQLQIQQETCVHAWVWRCSGHNDDAYECTKCKKIKWE